jgi:hypothetical protein
MRCIGQPRIIHEVARAPHKRVVFDARFLLAAGGGAGRHGI